MTTLRDDRVLDLFAGPGGWDTGVADLGLRPLGVERDTAAVETGQAAGHWRYQADVAALDPRQFAGTRGLIASPPCQGFSAAGKGKGRADAGLLLEAIPQMLRRDVRAELHARMTDDRSVLVLEPLRYALALTPSWLAWEQVPAVLPIWEACADVLRSIGYSVATGTLQAEQYGVPQTRKRAILVARAPWMTATMGPAQLPTPTHSRYYSRSPQKLDQGVLPWVSMAQALGWGQGSTVATGNFTALARDADGGRSRVGSVPYERDVDVPAPTVTGVTGRWVYVNGTHEHAARRPEDRPAPTVMFGARVNGVTWQPETSDDVAMCSAGRTAPHSAGQVPRDPHHAPSATITGKGTAAWVQRSNYNDGQSGADGRRWPAITSKGFNWAPADTAQDVKTSRRVTVGEASVLQSFPADYPWQGTKTAQYRQVGDAVPPLLARAVVAEVAGLAIAGDVEVAA